MQLMEVSCIRRFPVADLHPFPLELRDWRALSSQVRDEAIARYVMGWRTSTFRVPDDAASSDAGMPHTYLHPPGHFHVKMHPPAYSSDLSATWQVVEELLHRDRSYVGWYLRFGLECSRGAFIGWIASFTPGRLHPHAGETDYWKRKGRTIPEAICLAALFVVNAMKTADEEGQP